MHTKKRPFFNFASDRDSDHIFEDFPVIDESNYTPPQPPGNQSKWLLAIIALLVIAACLGGTYLNPHQLQILGVIMLVSLLIALVVKNIGAQKDSQ